HQRHVATTLARLGVAIVQAGLGSPSVIVVGDVLHGLAAAAQPAEPPARAMPTPPVAGRRR
ncbi:MAG TPA: uroporphyrinogen-III C-methyltransferase, partial [Variovorax sp.]|nr:uroporphyrinogen-III C-methyltransferase [Variovorax sp.]